MRSSRFSESGRENSFEPRGRPLRVSGEKRKDAAPPAQTRRLFPSLPEGGESFAFQELEKKPLGQLGGGSPLRIREKGDVGDGPPQERRLRPEEKANSPISG